MKKKLWVFGDYVGHFVKGFLHGAKETPKGLFAPAIALWRLLVSVTDSLMEKDSEGKHA